jgi:uncharacterized protein YndB with AHSA1/START domain
MPNTPIIIERTYETPIANVWSALTELKQMKQWYFDISAFEPKVGFEFRFTGQNEGRIFLHICKITEIVPGRKISYSWRYENHPGSSIVTFELFPEGEKTKLRLTHEGIETFPATGDFARSNFEMGWNHIIGISLKEFLEKA